MVKHLSNSKNLSKIKTVIFDCDGVFWLVDQLTPGSLELVEWLKEHNIRVFFLTNNSTKTQASCLEKISRLGFKDISKKDILTSAIISAKCLKNIGHKKVFVIGSDAIEECLSNDNVKVVRHKEITDKTVTQKIEDLDLSSTVLDDSVDAVLIGLDLAVNTMKVILAATYAKRGVKIYATNKDASFPNPYGFVMPGAGSNVATVETAMERTVDATFGKPNTFATELIENFDPNTTMMVGDRIDTDIQFGINSGCGISCLVLSGITKNQEDAPEKAYYASSVADILKSFKNL